MNYGAIPTNAAADDGDNDKAKIESISVEEPKTHTFDKKKKYKGKKGEARRIEWSWQKLSRREEL